MASSPTNTKMHTLAAICSAVDKNETGGVAAAAASEMVSSPAAQKQEKQELPSSSTATAEMQPYPFFLYRDFSKVKAPHKDSSGPPKSPNNFPTKMHAILSDPELEDVVGWLPHGRSWRILRPKEFERRVIPAWFEHTKFSSFIRQANGWGFRRVIQGRDRGSYYHELFLRGMPHLCKGMKRPGKAMKIAIDTDHEPDLYKIAELLPLPDATVVAKKSPAAKAAATPAKRAVSQPGTQNAAEAMVACPSTTSAFAMVESRESPVPAAAQLAPQGRELLQNAIRACQNQVAAQSNPLRPALNFAPVPIQQQQQGQSSDEVLKTLILALLTEGRQQPPVAPRPVQEVPKPAPANNMMSTILNALSNQRVNMSEADRMHLMLQVLAAANIPGQQQQVPSSVSFRR